MLRSSFFQDLMASIFANRRHLAKSSSRNQPSSYQLDLEELCREILCGKGEVSEMNIAADILRCYEASSETQKNRFFQMLASDYDLDLDYLQLALQSYREEPTAENLSQFLQAAEPQRQELFRRINRAPGATHSLVKMREDLFGYMKQEPALKRVDIDFAHLFSSWFNRGFLVLQPIDWNTPAQILQKIIKYEAVHAIGDWDELQRRLEPSDRRCYAFFHPAVPAEPLIFVEVALTRSIPGSVESVLQENRTPLEAEDATTAVFYSISNCQSGLRGISFGNFLIKQVAKELAASLPDLDTYVTLSPVPGFANWLRQQAERDPAGELALLYQALNQPSADEQISAISRHHQELTAVAARYLVSEKHKDGLALDPVARFHLGNGACLHAIHSEANLSPRGRKESFGIMVNYRYDLDRVEANHEAYVTRGEVQAAAEIVQLAEAAVPPATKENKK